MLSLTQSLHHAARRLIYARGLAFAAILTLSIDRFLDPFPSGGTPPSHGTHRL